MRRIMSDKRTSIEFYMTCPICLNTIYCNKTTLVNKNKSYLIDCPSCMNTIEIKKY